MIFQRNKEFLEDLQGIQIRIEIGIEIEKREQSGNQELRKRMFSPTILPVGRVSRPVPLSPEKKNEEDGSLEGAS